MSYPTRVTLLDGPVGTELLARGVATPLPRWSAAAIDSHPATLAAIHAAYAAAGATVHTANTFRTRRRQVGGEWRRLANAAVEIARNAVPSGQWVAGSLAPLEDCYRPDLSPDHPREEHRELARALAAAGVDLLLCETFPHVGEALVAVEECVATGVETWVSFTAGPDSSLLTPAAIRDGARAAVERGARAVLVNCIPAVDALRFVEAVAGFGVPFGAYANAGAPEDGMGWRAEASAPERYAELARTWAAAGATLLGSCCGTGPGHIAALAREFG